MLGGLVDEEGWALLETRDTGEQENRPIGVGSAVVTQVYRCDAGDVHRAKEVDIQDFMGWSLEIKHYFGMPWAGQATRAVASFHIPGERPPA